MFIAAALTVLIEGLFLFIAGSDRMRSAIGLCYIALVNIFTNVTLNVSTRLLIHFDADINLAFWVYPMEAAVVAVEYVMYLPLFRSDKRLFILTLAANVISYLAGVLIFGHIK